MKRNIVLLHVATQLITGKRPGSRRQSKLFVIIYLRGEEGGGGGGGRERTLLTYSAYNCESLHPTLHTHTPCFPQCQVMKAKITRTFKQRSMNSKQSLCHFILLLFAFLSCFLICLYQRLGYKQKTPRYICLYQRLGHKKETPRYICLYQRLGHKQRHHVIYAFINVQVINRRHHVIYAFINV